MCGRYAFFQRPSVVRQRLQDANMPSDDAPDDDTIRQSYNFAPGYYGLVYRAETSDYGAGPKPGHNEGEEEDVAATSKQSEEVSTDESSPTHYKLQAMKWGLIPSWTKRNPDYGTLMRTINCRDDSLAENRGMWVSMKKRKRCIVICHGFYEWLKKNNGKERIPHYIKRKDSQLMCFAALWDVVKYDDAEDEKTYTYTVITTDSNRQLNFLHDRMPVIFTPGSEEIRTWLDPGRHEWTKELQSLLKPWDGELEIYPVSKEVGKVGNDSPSFIIPIDSKENKSNIANFFSNQAKSSKAKDETKTEVKIESQTEGDTEVKDENTETHAPMSVPSPTKSAVKREHSENEGDIESPERATKVQKTEATPIKPSRKAHSATSNGTVPKASPKASKQTQAAQGTHKITNFFAKQGG
ncbi:DUF159-domain-containing protein [Microthyrium microscopicum]|uniref:DUF159-domain-containing protein n=1 Tax=Microthyrium microscopicum TaxID=703497 RepID=A0A6A6USR7_9PEZI|nr:DUF159-domain-containing protein [Microthyrium microscopicum]